MSQKTTIQNKNICFLPIQNKDLMKMLNITSDEFEENVQIFKQEIISRGEKEVEYWQQKISSIKNYTKEMAIESLIKSLKLNEKISSINNYIDKLRG